MLARVHVLVAIKVFTHGYLFHKERERRLDSQMAQEHDFSCRHHLCLALTPFQLIVNSSLPPLGQLYCSLILAAWHWLGTEVANALILNHPPRWCIAIDTLWVSLAAIHIDRIAGTPRRSRTVVFFAGLTWLQMMTRAISDYQQEINLSSSS